MFIRAIKYNLEGFQVYPPGYSLPMKSFQGLADLRRGFLSVESDDKTNGN